MKIFERETLFKNLEEKHKKNLFFASIYNDSRFHVNDKLERFNLVTELVEKYPGLLYPLDRDDWLLPMTIINWKTKILEAWKKLSTMSGINPLMKSFILNKWLIYQGYCPFVHFAFSKWHDLGTILDVIQLADLSTTYLYKLVPNDINYNNDMGKFIGEGAYGKVYLSKNKKNVIKYPKNLAGQVFMNNLEISVYDVALNTDLIKYMVPVVSFDIKNSIIEKIYIEGVSGWKLLEQESFRKNPYAIKELEKIYLAACHIYANKNINIDIHPGNFQWSYAESRWYLVDYGSMPEIGADYFPRDDFEKYFKKIWLDLHDLMISEPIRSLDIDIPSFL